MGTGRKRIPMKKIENMNHRRVTFTKRRQGLCRKAAKLSLLTGCKIAILTFSCANTPFFYGDERDLLLERAAAGAFGNFNCGKFNTLSSAGASCSTYVGEEAEAGLENFSGCGDGGDNLLLEAATAGSFGNLDCGKLNTLSGTGLEVGSCSASPSEEAGLENFSGCGDGGDILLLEAAAAGSFGTLDCGKLNTLSGTGLEVASCSASPSEEAGLGNFSEVADDNKDLFLTEDDIEQLFADIEVDTDVAADNAGCDMDASPMPSTTGDNAFQTIPCSSSAMSESYFFDDLSSADHTLKYYYKDTETVLLGSSSNACQSTSCLKESDESLGTCDFTDDGCSPEEENLDLQLLMKRRMEMEAWREGMRDRFRMACEAGDMISELYSEENPFIEFSNNIYMC